MTSLLLTAALAGLAGTPHCIGMCGGFAAAATARGGRRGALAWSAGRITTYGMLGAIAGGVGNVIPGPAWLPSVVAAALLVWFALGLAGLVRAPAGHIPWLATVARRFATGEGSGHRFALGLATGLLPCGLVYAALALAIGSGSALLGAGVMLAFGAATLPGLSVLAVSVQRFALTTLWRRRALAAVVLVVGIWSIGQRATRAHAHGAEPAPVAAPGPSAEPHTR